MSTDDKKTQNTFWWIGSIAISVFCCSILFVLFASYLVEVKSDIKDTNFRINSIEKREDAILANIEIIRKHGIVIAPAAASDVSAPVSSSSPNDVGGAVVVPDAVQNPTVGATAQHPADSVTISVVHPASPPVMQVAPEKK